MAKVLTQWTEGIRQTLETSTTRLTEDFSSRLESHANLNTQQFTQLAGVLDLARESHEQDNALSFQSLSGQLGQQEYSYEQRYLSVSEDIDKYPPLEQSIESNLAEYRSARVVEHSKGTHNGHPGYIPVRGPDSQLGKLVPPLDNTGKVPHGYLPSDVLYAATPAFEEWLINNLDDGMSTSEKLLLNPSGTALLAKVYDPSGAKMIPLTVVTDTLLSTTSTNPLATNVFSLEIEKYQQKSLVLTRFSNLSLSSSGFLTTKEGQGFGLSQLTSNSSTFTIEHPLGHPSVGTRLSAKLGSDVPKLITDVASGMGSSEALARADHTHAVGHHAVTWDVAWEANVRSTKLSGFTSLSAVVAAGQMPAEATVLSAYAFIQSTLNSANVYASGMGQFIGTISTLNSAMSSQQGTLESKLPTSLSRHLVALVSDASGEMTTSGISTHYIGHLRFCPQNLGGSLATKEPLVKSPTIASHWSTAIVAGNELYHYTGTIAEIYYEDVRTIPVGKTFYFTGGPYGWINFKSATSVTWVGGFTPALGTILRLGRAPTDAIVIYRMNTNAFWVMKI